MLLSAAIFALSTCALSGYKLDLSFLSEPCVILFIVFLSITSTISLFIRLIKH